MTEHKKARPDGGASGQAAGSDRAGQQSHEKYSTTHDKKARAIYDLLPVGAEYAISRRQLSAITGIPDRQLRRRIAQERRAGVLILSSSESNGGYYRAASREELQRYVRSMQSRCKEIAAVIRAAEEALAAAEGGGNDG